MKRILPLIIVIPLVFFGSLFMVRFIRDGFYPLATILGACTVFVALVFLKPSLSPYRWLAIGIVLAVMFTIYPILYTLYLSVTNMSGGHLLTKQQAISRISSQSYTPDEAASYSWTAYRRDDGAYLLVVSDNTGRFGLAKPGEELQFRADLTEVPETVGAYRRLDLVETMQRLQELSALQFGQPPDLISIKSLREAAISKAIYDYNPADDIFTDTRTGTRYEAQRGTYTAVDGQTLIPGFMVYIGFDNYQRFIGNPGYLRPILNIIVWNILFALLSVLISFAVGLIIALAFEDLKGKRLIRSLLILPYPIPVLVAIMVWRALLNERMGLVTAVLNQFFGTAPRFFTDVFWAQFALILINVYLSYPYFYILSSGALKSIPNELFEAAKIDGAGAFTLLRRILLPMLLRILGPLLIASFSFNFNNFTLVWGFNAGLPAMADTIVPMGYTDLLISFIYRLGFSTSSASDYGFSAAITVMLFIFVSLMVFFQTMNSKAMKESL